MRLTLIKSRKPCFINDAHIEKCLMPILFTQRYDAPK